MGQIKKNIDCKNAEILKKLFGAFDENVNMIERNFSVKITQGDNSVIIIGEENDVLHAAAVIENLLMIPDEIDIQKTRYFTEMELIGQNVDYTELLKDVFAVTAKGKQIKAKTVGQKHYLEALKTKSVVFGVGPAGTGKTYLAVAKAVTAFRKNEVERIILTRPAVEAGEKLGFLPGDLQTKVDPYLRPLYDALQEMFGIDSYMKLIERGIIEIAPLAYMRGRTLSNAYIILDEAQNTTIEQMKMFLTRMGEGSKVIVTGDVTQIDLPEGKQSGLKHAVKILKDIDGIEVCYLTHRDVVRHDLVQSIIKAYENSNRKNTEERG